MALMDILAGAHGGSFFAIVGQIASVDDATSQRALSVLAPAIADRLHERAKDEEAFEALLDLLEDGEGDGFLDDASMIGGKEVRADGKAILKDLYGTQDKATKEGMALTGLAKTQVEKLMPIAAASVLAALVRANGGGAQPLAGGTGSGGGLLGTIVSAVIDGVVKGAAQQLAPKRRRRRYTGYSSYRKKRKSSTKRRTRKPTLESIFRSILTGR
jgi:hypothetical protein